MAGDGEESLSSSCSTAETESTTLLFLMVEENNKKEKKKIMMRIADVLNTDDNDYDDDDDFIGVKEKKNHRRIEGCNSISLRSIISHWISSFKRSKDLMKKTQRRRSNIEQKDCLKGMEGTNNNGSFLLEDSSEGNDEDLDRSIEKSEDSNSLTEIVPTPVSPLGSYMKDASFSLGVGAGLVYLMVSARNEFRKMTELRSQIESLIEDGVRKKNVNGNKPSESNSVIGFSTTGSPAVENVTTTQNCVSSHNLVKSKVDVKHDEHLECLESKEECVVGIDELEAEFEAELERLQLSLDNEDSLDHSRQQEQEMVYVNSAPVRSDSSSFGIKDDPGELDTEEQSGVPPHELERRLHELVEARQQERIKELESALEHVKHELHKKEMEISRWKDTARRFSPHVSEATPLSRVPTQKQFAMSAVGQ